jgi:hypothetical protein
MNPSSYFTKRSFAPKRFPNTGLEPRNKIIQSETVAKRIILGISFIEETLVTGSS